MCGVARSCKIKFAVQKTKIKQTNVWIYVFGDSRHFSTGSARTKLSSAIFKRDFSEFQFVSMFRETNYLCFIVWALLRASIGLRQFFVTFCALLRASIGPRWCFNLHSILLYSFFGFDFVKRCIYHKHYLFLIILDVFKRWISSRAFVWHRFHRDRTKPRSSYDRNRYALKRANGQTTVRNSCEKAWKGAHKHMHFDFVETLIW